jgi:transketolase
MAWAAKKDGRKYRVFVLLSDGECDEGSTWEAILFAGHHRLDNLAAIVDYNKWQSFGRTKDTLNLEPFIDKWKAFNWSVRETDGHDLEKIVSVLKQIPFEDSRPSVVIAHTVKGKGLLSLEDKLESHYIHPSPEEAEKIKEEINRL